MIVGITGSNGFIGRKLVSYLRQKGIEVAAGTRENADVTDKEKVDKFVKEVKIIVHLAAYQNVFDDSYNKFEAVTVLGSKNVLEAAKKYNKKVILFSSEVVFGNKSDFYTKSKKAQVRLAKKYKQVEIVYPPVVIDFKQKKKWWQLTYGGVMMMAGDRNKNINYIDMEDLCRFVYEKITSNTKTRLPIKTLTKTEFLKKMKKEIGGWQLPFRISKQGLKGLNLVLNHTKYGRLIESILENE